MLSLANSIPKYIYYLFLKKKLIKEILISTHIEYFVSCKQGILNSDT